MADRNTLDQRSFWNLAWPAALEGLLLVLLILCYFLFFRDSDHKEPSLPASSSVSASQAVSDSASAPVSESAPESAAPAIPRDEWYMKLVNRENVLDASFSPPELATVGGQQVDSRIAEPLQQMIDAAKAEGINLQLTAGYRSYERQAAAYNNGQGTSDCPPGASEHNLGLSVDIQSAEEHSYNTAAFEATSAFTWLRDNAATYGFIMRYPSDKVDVTGFSYEPWHYRYVGVEQAQLIKASGLTLEEYLAQDAPTAAASSTVTAESGDLIG